MDAAAHAIIGPQPFGGQDLRAMMPWAKARFIDRDTLEAVMVLRRAIFISGSRIYDLDRMAYAASTGHISGACYVYQHGVAEHATRERGSTLDFGAAPQALFADLAASQR